MNAFNKTEEFSNQLQKAESNENVEQVSLREKELDARLHSLTELTPIAEFSNDDVFIVGYPKSGNTWFQNLITDIVYGVNAAQAPDSLVQDLVPDVHYKRYYKRYRTPMFFKSHHLPKAEYKRVVYLLRDGRDVMVSQFHHMNALKDRKVDFLKMVQNDDNILFPCKWHEHVEAWLSNPYNAEIIVVKYEDLCENPVRQLQKLCQFICIEVDSLFLQKVVQQTSFDKMRQKEAKWGWDNPIWPKDKFFVRRGKIGSYEDEMPPEVLDSFLKDAEKTLNYLGYLKSSSCIIK